MMEMFQGDLKYRQILTDPKSSRKLPFLLSGQAQLYIDMVIHDVAIAASKTQVHSAIALIESTDLLRMKNKYKKFRPADLSSPKAK